MKLATVSAIFLLTILVAGAVLAFVTQDKTVNNPLAEFIGPDGRLTIPGGKMTREIQNLLFPPKAPETYYTYAPERSVYPTLDIAGTEHKYADFRSSYRAPSYADSVSAGGFLLSRIVTPIWDTVRGMASDVFDFFVGSASAATKTWDNGGGDATWNNCANWSGDTCPDAYDDVIFDGTSTANASANVVTIAYKSLSLNAGYTGTVTISTAQTAPWGAVSIAAGTLDASGNAAFFGSLTMTGGTLTLGAATITIIGAYAGVSTANPTGSPGISSTGLLRAYDMATETAGALKDFATAADHATENGGVTVGGAAGNFGSATTFDGTNDSFTGTAPSTPSSYTWATWLSPTASGARLFLSLDTLGCNYGSYGIVIANKFHAAFTTACAAYDSSPASTVSIYHAVVLTCNGTTAELWVDGDKTNTGTACSGTHTWDQLKIGEFVGNDYYQGDMDELVIFSRAWSDAEVRQFSSLNGSGNWNSNAGSTTFNAGTSTVVMTGASTTVADNGSGVGTQAFYNITISGTVSQNSTLDVSNTLATSGSGTLTTSTQNIAGGAAVSLVGTGGITSTSGSFTVGAVTIGTGTTWSVTTATITVNGNWDSSAGTFTQGTSLVKMEGTGKTVKTTFYDLTIDGDTTLAANLTVTNLLTVNALLDTDAVNNYSMTLMDATISVGGAISLGSGSHTVAGDWSNLSTSVSWDAGTGTLTFTSSVGINLDFAGTNLAEDEFNNVTFNSSSLGIVTIVSGSAFGIRWSGTLTVTDTSGGTVLETNGRVMAGGALSISGTGSRMQWTNGTGNAGAVTLTTVNISAGNGGIEFGSEPWTVSGTWTNSATNASNWDAGTSTVTFTSATGGTMTFAGANLSEDEFNNVTFTSSAATAQTFTMATRGLRWGGTLTVSDTSSTTALATANLALTGGALVVGNAGTLTANTSTVSVSNVTMTGGTSGTITLTSGAWAVMGNWDTSGAGSVFTKGTSTVTMSGASKTVSIRNSSNGFFNLITSGTITMGTAIDASGTLTVSGTLATASLAISGSANLVVPDAGTLTANASTLTFTDVTMTGGASGTITLTTAAMTVSGNWDTSGAGSTFTKGTSAVTMSGTSKTVAVRSIGGFYNFTVTGTISANSNVSVDNTMTISAGSFAAGTTALNVGPGLGSLVLSGGALTFTSGVIGSVNDVNISSASSYIVFGSSTGHVVQGSWTNISTSASWDKGTGTVQFSSPTSKTMTFGDATNYVGGVEFNNATFNPNNGGVSPVFTIAGFQLKMGGALSVTNGNAPGTTTLTDATNNKGITAGNVTVGVRGALTMGSATITVSGNWDSSAGTFTKGTSTVTMSGASKTVKQQSASANGFYNLTISGTVSILTNALDVSNTLATSGSGTLTTAGLNITGGAAVLLVGTGGITATTSAMTVGNVTVGAGTTLSFTSGSATVSGNWDSSAGTFNAGTSLVKMEGTGKTVKTAFYDLTINGSTTLAANLTVTNLLTVNALLDTDAVSNYSMTLKDATISAGGAISLGSNSHTVSGTWTNGSTNAAWDAGSGTVTFTSATGGTMTFAGANLSEDEFNNVTFTSSAGTAQTFTMDLRGLRLGGLLTLSDTGAGNTTILDTGADLAITTGTLTVTTGGQLNANASTVTVSGTANFTGGAFIEGTSTLVMAATGTLTTDVTGSRTVNGVYNLTINVGATVTLGINIGVGQVLTLNGTITGAARAIFFNSTSATPLVLGASHDFGTIDTVNLASTVNYSVPASTDYPTLDIESDGATVATLAGNIAALTIEIANVPLAITLDANSRTITLTQGIAITLAGAGLTFTSGSLVTQSTNSIINDDAFIQWGSGSHTMASRWINNNAGVNANWDAGTGTVTFTALDPSGGDSYFFNDQMGENEFFNVTFTSSGAGAQVFTMDGNGLMWGGTLTITDSTGGTRLAKATFALTGGALTIGGAAASGLTSTSGAVSVSTVSVSTATSYIDFGSEAWTVSGDWTNSTTSASWDAGTGTATFTSATGGTITFAGTNLSEDEFNNVTFTSSAGTAQTFTMDTRGLRLGGTLTISDGSSTTALTTSGSNLAVTAGAVTVGSGGTLTANASTITVSGNWDSSAGTFTAGASAVTMSGIGTVAINGLAGFYDLTVSGTVTMATDIIAFSSLTTTALGTMDAGNPSFSIESPTLTFDGTLLMDGFSPSDFSFAASAGTITLTEWQADLPSGIPPDVTWVFEPSVAGAVVTMTLSGFAASTNLGLYRDGGQVAVGQSDGSGVVTFPITGGWSSRVMHIGFPVPGGGGGGGGDLGMGILVTQVSGLTYKFTIDAKGNVISSVNWDFGDGTVGAGLVVYHTYAREGQYRVAATVRVGSESASLSRDITITTQSLIGYVIALITVVAILGGLLARSEKLKLDLSVLAIGLLAFQLSPFFMFGQLVIGRDFISILLLGMSLKSFALSFLPTDKKDRARGAWFLFGVIAIALWWYLVLV